MPEPTSGIFICYRRDPDAPFAGRLHDRLTGKFGADRVFMDIDNIEPGEVFTEVLAKTLDQAVVMIVLIGRDWLTREDARGRTKLSNPKDFVRIEVATALKRNVRVIPILIDEARMPEAEDVPEDLAPLSERHAITIHHDRFHLSAERLIEVCDKVLRASMEPVLASPSTLVVEEKHEAPTIITGVSRPAGETRVNRTFAVEACLGLNWGGSPR